MKFYLGLLAVILFSTTCQANSNGIPLEKNFETDRFTLKKGESKTVENFKIKCLSVGHTFGGKGHSFYANLEVTENEKISKTTLEIGETIPLGEKYLKLVAIDEKADPKLTDPFAATSCTLSVENQPGEKSVKNIKTTSTSKFGLILTSPNTQFCFKNEGLKSEITISFAVKGSKISLGEFKETSYDGAPSADPYPFTGRKTGNILTIKFTGKVPDEFDQIKEIVWTLSKKALKVQIFGKNYNNNKWSVYVTSFNKCEL